MKFHKNLLYNNTNTNIAIKQTAVTNSQTERQIRQAGLKNSNIYGCSCIEFTMCILNE